MLDLDIKSKNTHTNAEHHQENRVVIYLTVAIMSFSSTLGRRNECVGQRHYRKACDYLILYVNVLPHLNT